MTASYKHTERLHEDVTHALATHAVELMKKRFPEIYADIEAHLDTLLATGEYAEVCRDKVQTSATEAIAQAAYVEMIGAGEPLGYERDRDSQYSDNPHACDKCKGVGELDVRVA